MLLARAFKTVKRPHRSEPEVPVSMIVVPIDLTVAGSLQSCLNFCWPHRMQLYVREFVFGILGIGFLNVFIGIMAIRAYGLQINGTLGTSVPFFANRLPYPASFGIDDISFSGAGFNGCFPDLPLELSEQDFPFLWFGAFVGFARRRSGSVSGSR